MKMINLTETSISDKILKNLKHLKKYNNFSTDGFYSKKCSIFLEKTLKINKVLMTSCTLLRNVCF